jgi:hypothetical protein
VAVGTHDEIRLFDAGPVATEVARSLADDYVVPPFSYLDTRQGYWQDRAQRWRGLGLKSEVGRDGDLTYGAFDNPDISAHGFAESGAQTSVFDPVLTELVYRWYSPTGGVVLDPFAGGSVRGVLASALNRTYCGIELRGEQVAANYDQSREILNPGSDATAGDPITLPRWVEGDARSVLADPGANLIPRADLLFTCPPYGDLEVYSEDPADLSNMPAADFDQAYREILALGLERLNPDRFAVLVVGRYRNKDGGLRDLVGQTVQAMERAGARFYDEAILLNNVGTGAVRARKQMETSRKLVRLHQHALVFVKGDSRAATAAINGAT